MNERSRSRCTLKRSDCSSEPGPNPQNKRIRMEFLKNNYEKVILSVVLLGLAVAAVLLLTWVGNEKRALEEIEGQIIQTPPKPLKPIDLSTNEVALQRLLKPPPQRLVGEHNLVNPVQWKRMADGRLIPLRTGREIGPGALAIARITPLYLRIEYEGVGGSGDTTQYRFKVTREAEKSPSKRIPITLSVATPGSKNPVFVLKDMKPKDNPAEFVLELSENNEPVTVTKDKPYVSVAGYLADLKYDPEKLTFIGKRQGDALVFAGDTNKIVAITATNVTVQATSNTKRTTVTYAPTP